MKPWFKSALCDVPEGLREEYKASVARCIQARVRVFCLTAYGLYMLCLSAIVLTDSGTNTMHRINIAILMTIGTGAMLFYNRKMVKCIHTAKINAFGFICFMLFMLHFAPIEAPGNFQYAGYMLMLLFSTLLFPWFFRDAVLVNVIHFGAWLAYYSTRDLELITLPATAFGTGPFWNGTAFIGMTAIISLLIRYKDNQRDIYNFILLKDVEAKKAQMESELEFASRIQDSLVPQPLESPHADVYITYKPMESIGGDYANFQMVDENRLVFFIGDVTGHGVPAALMVNRLHSEFDRLAASGERPGAILRDLNQFILKAFDATGLYLTAFCGMVDFKDKRIYYSNYGHPPQYIFRLHEEAVAGLESLTSFLGIDLGDQDKIYENHIEYQEGDLIVMFTDGILEHKSASGEEYGGDRVQRFIKGHATLGPKDIHAQLMRDITSFGQGPFKDDVFIISIQCKSSISSTPALPS